MVRNPGFIRFLLGTALALSFLSVSSSGKPPQDKNKPGRGARAGAANDSEEGEGDNVRRREEWFYRQRRFPLDHIPGGARQRALDRVEEMRREQRAARGNQAATAKSETSAAAAPRGGVTAAAPALSTTMWTPIGPMPTSTFAPVNTVSGRVSALAVDPTNANTVFVGGAQGGVWKSINGGTTWTPTFDSNGAASAQVFPKSLAIGGIAIDPKNTNIIYVGTGEENFAQDAYYGAGIYKSIDGGATWTQTAGTISPAIPGSSITSFNGPFNQAVGGVHIGAIVVHPQTSMRVFAAVQIFQNVDGGLASGIFCSDDSGSTWTQVVGGAVGTDIAVTPAGSIAYAALGSPGGDNFSTDTVKGENGVYKTTQANTSCTNQQIGHPGAWQKLTNPGGLASINMGRIRLDSDSTGNVVYAMVADGTSLSDTLAGIFKTTNGGTSWTNVTPAQVPDICAQQCFFDMIIKVHPNDPMTVFAGGSAHPDNSGNPFFLIRSINGGASWAGIARDAVGTQLHVDQHAIAFGFSGANVTSMFVGNDGGVWSTPLALPTSPVVWRNLNQTLQMTQFYNGLANHPVNPQIAIAGAQDNGTQMYDGAINGVKWTELSACGDGGYNAIDPAAPTTIYSACQDIDIRRSMDGGANFVEVDTNGIDSFDRSEFIPPLVIDPNPATSNRLYFGTFRVWQTMNGGASWSAISPDLTSGAASLDDITSISVSPKNSNVVYVGSFGSGSSGTILQRTTQANLGTGALNTWTQIDGGTLPPRAITQVAGDPNNQDVVFVTMSGFNCTGNPMCLAGDNKGHVFRCSGVSPIGCTDISGGLPNIPVNTIVVDPLLGSNTIYIGTDVGVFGTIDGGVTWLVDYPGMPNGFPNVAVFGLALQPTARILRAVTHGRGAWDLQLAGVLAYSITGVSPPTAAAGTSGPFLLTVSGSGFSPTSKVLFNNLSHTPVSQTATQLTVNLTTAELAAPGTVNVQVSDAAQPPPGTTNTLPFTITTAPPTVTASVPGSTAVGVVANLTITGKNFITTSQVRINNNGGSVSDMLAPSGPPTNNGTTINVTVPMNAQSVQNPGTYFVSVFNPPPGGGDSSQNSATAPPNFVVTPMNNTPPPNDNISAAINCPGNGPCDNTNNVNATVNTGGVTDPLPTCVQNIAPPNNPANGGAANSFWYKFTASGPGTIEADTINSLDDTILAAYAGAASSSNEVACNDDITSGVVRTSQVNFTAVQGTTYFFMVSSFNGAGGKVIFNLNANIAGPTNFTISAAPTSQTVSRGNSGMTTLTVSPNIALFPGDVTFSCTGLPTESACVFNPAKVLQAAGATPVMVTITTMRPSSIPPGPRGGPGAGPFGLLLWALAAVSLMGLFAARHAARRWRYVFSLTLLVISVGLAMSCGGGGGAPIGGGDPGSLPTGPNMVMIKATSGNVNQTAPFTLTLQ
jgi:photosystem II stability/assembly factor-like uncharacterized protein